METCDKCGPYVAAKATIILPSGGRLTLCGHCCHTYFGDDKDPGVDFTMITQLTFGDTPAVVPSPADVCRRA